MKAPIPCFNPEGSQKCFCRQSLDGAFSGVLTLTDAFRD